jgi:hypothetical protein
MPSGATPRRAALAGHPDYPHHDVYEDENMIAFLARNPPGGEQGGESAAGQERAE